MTEQGIGYLRSEAWAQIVPGFVSKAAVVEGMRELAEDDVALGVSAAQAEDLVDGLWAERLAYLAGPSIRTPTDDVRIADAFDRLGEEGIVARMNCGFDQSEGEALCRDAAQGRGSHGFVFFHSQDAGRFGRCRPVPRVRRGPNLRRAVHVETGLRRGRERRRAPDRRSPESTRTDGRMGRHAQ